MSDPFFVLATQNPIEQEGTYPLPEAQQDRFMFKVFVKYPKLRRRVRDRAADHRRADRSTWIAVLTAEEIVQLQEMVREVPVSRIT